MGLFDKFFKTEPASFQFKPKNEQEAWVCILYACGTIDGELSDVEVETLSKLFVYKTFFNGHDTISYYKNVMKTKESIDSKTIIDKSADLVSEENKNTVFTLCCEVLLSDGKLDDDEKLILEHVASALKIIEETAIKIIEVMLYRNKWNTIIRN